MSDGQSDAEAPAAVGRKCFLVLGMHRSGTSALTRVLNLLGTELPKHLVAANLNNEAGYWEPERLVAVHDAMLAEAGSHWDDWRAFDPGTLGVERLAHYKAEIARLIEEEYGDAPMFVIKDPRICRFAGLYEEVLRALDITPFYLLQLRDPFAVIKSLASRDGMTAPFAGLVWLRHSLDAEQATRGKPHVVLSYERLIGDWRGTVSEIGARLKLAWPLPTQRMAGDIEAFLDRRLTHHSATIDQLAGHPDIASWVTETYQALLALEKGCDQTACRAALDRIRTVFGTAAFVVGDAVFTELSARDDKLTVEKSNISRQQAELDLLYHQLAEREERIRSLESTISMFHASKSWRITTPLRVARRFLGRLR